MSDIKKPETWAEGRRKIDWVRANMPLLNRIEKKFKEERPFEGLKIALSIHLEAKTAYLCETLAAGGAQMYITGSNPLSTQDDVAAALVRLVRLLGAGIYGQYPQGSLLRTQYHH